jgi:hypothetical protein
MGQKEFGLKSGVPLRALVTAGNIFCYTLQVDFSLAA